MAALVVAAGCGRSEPVSSGAPPSTATTAPVCGRQGTRTTYCGAATVSVDLGGTSFAYSGGECHTGPGHVVVVIGTFPDEGGNEPDRFVLGVGNYEQDPVFGTATTPAPFGPGAEADGTHRRSVLRVYTGGKRSSARDVPVTLEGGRTRGTFAGTTDDGTAISGRFACS